MFNENEDGIKSEDYLDSKVEISQKGVLVENYESSMLTDTITKINLKQKINIQISRNSFGNTNQLNPILDEINSEIFISFINKLKEECILVDIAKICYKMMSVNPFWSRRFIQLIKNFLYIKLNSTDILTVNNFLERNIKMFYLAVNKDNIPDSKFTFVECFHDNDERYLSGFFKFSKIFNYLNYSKVIVKKNDKYYLLLDNTLESLDLKDDDWNGYTFVYTKNIEFVYTNPYLISGLAHDRIRFRDLLYNYNHPYISQVYEIIKNKNLIGKQRQILIEILDYIIEHDFSENFELDKLNVLVSEGAKYLGIDYKFSNKDFFIKT